ncbi:MAG: transglutaminase-like domain-containing protein [Planctomycetota bacterium]|nr:transglutaminase-like domain-containing protein [Planctomycetota bacterium]
MRSSMWLSSWVCSVIFTFAVCAAENTRAVVVASDGAMADLEWMNVVSALSVSQNAEVLSWSESVNEVRTKLVERMPRYTTFVALPTEVGRAFVASVHQLARSLDGDSWSDTRWGIVTGRTADDALRIATRDEPIAVRIGFGGTGIPLDQFDSGVWFNEGAAGARTQKTADGTTTTTVGATDTTADLVNAFNAIHPDFMMTSGHASQRDWQIGYSFPSGSLQGRSGALVGVDVAGVIHPILSPNPKVMLAAGNCLLGFVDGPDALALAFLGDEAGFDQLVGYTIKSWAGCGGWGTRDWFFSDPGRYSLHEAFWINNQLIVDALERESPGASKQEVVGFLQDDPMILLRDCFQKASANQTPDQLKSLAGLLWDRDSVAFYGRPDRDARLSRRGDVWDSEIDDQGNVVRVTVFAPDAVSIGKPPAVFLPRRLTNVRCVENAGLDPIIADDFVIFRGLERLAAGERRTIVLADDGIATKPSKREIPPWGELLKLAAQFPSAYRADLIKSLSVAEENQGEIAAFLGCAVDLSSTDPFALDAAGFLIAFMPEGDLQSIRSELLCENLEYALRARRESRWSADAPDEVWLDAVLPYAHVNERRDAWRKMYFDRYFARSQSAETKEEVVQLFNDLVFKDQHVVYHATKRPKSNQSPFESADAGYASCSGLSIMLADALRACGIPARVVGIPLWLEKTGNHTWIEVWDQGQWRKVEAFSAGGYDDCWWSSQTAALAAANLDDPMHRIWASGWKRRPNHFVQVWDLHDKSVPADDVTASYAAVKAAK